MRNLALSMTVSPGEARGKTLRPILLICGLLLTSAAIWLVLTASGNAIHLAPDTNSPATVLDIGVLVFREGLECVLVLSAITAGLSGGRLSSRNPIAIGAGAGFIATLATWFAAVHVIDDLSQSVPALALQAATGLVAVVVLLVVMNWFFHKIYWTGWISLHNKRKRKLLERVDNQQSSRFGLFWGMALLGFTSLYREGFEVVLFLQAYRLKLGDRTVLWGVCAGLLLSGASAVLTFVAHQRLPYKKMLILTGGLLGVVLFVMVGEQVQEMQLAHWITTTRIPILSHVVPSWMELWLSIFPTSETLLAQAAATLLVLGSYVVANRRATQTRQPEEFNGSETDVRL